uniref:BTB domain-containing protein n=1 Tax=Panagrellus redivivus TaxID=6233 RepID=A0A7E4WCA5_PANRE
MTMMWHRTEDIGAELLLQQLHHLYETKESYDVLFIIDDVEVKAHRFILTMRSEFFKKMFQNSVKPMYRLHFATLNKEILEVVLEYIYTGRITLQDLTTKEILEVLELANVYILKELVDYVVGRLKYRMDEFSVPHILNTAISCNVDDLKDLCIDFIRENAGIVLTNERFQEMSRPAMALVLDNCIRVPQILVFEAFMKWVGRNRQDLRLFPFDLLVMIKLECINEHQLLRLNAPVPYMHHTTVTAIVQSQKEVEHVSMFPDINIAIPDKIFVFGNSVYIDLEKLYRVNCLKIRIMGETEHPYTVTVSSDYKTWDCVIDYSKYPCRGFQELRFTDRVVRYVRITSCSIAKFEVDLPQLQILYSTDRVEIDLETSLWSPKQNIATFESGARVIEGEANMPHALLIHPNDCLSWYKVGDAGLIVQLPQPYMLNCVKLNFSCVPSSYKVEVSSDYYQWTEVGGETNVREWRKIVFPKRPVMYVKLVGLKEHLFGKFFCRHLECFSE